MQKNKLYFGAFFKLHVRVNYCKFAGPNVGERKHFGTGEGMEALGIEGTIH